MEMESGRRYAGLKKLRLSEEAPIDQKRYVSKIRATGNDRERGDSESSDSGLGRGAFSSQEHQELVLQYKIALAELTFNSKPIITNLTIIAGENQHAAKAISATICTNILEVPSEQKLPSLYLLDSIVKNIGKDYIKYFGAKLPEVFCKAYRQVDPSTHNGMLHLFRTWKGVFPPQPLQIIEKELAFPPAVNGSSSGSATSRPDSQSQRPGNSIHVNPKYLERQRLQQPIRVKGITNDSTVTMVNSSRNAERFDKTVGTSSERQWPEPTLKTQNIQHPQRDTHNEFAREKNIIAAYGNYDHDSDHSSQSGLEIGRVTERVVDKPWYGVNTSLEEKLSIQRNGLDIKQGLRSYAPPTSEKTNVLLQQRKSISGRSSAIEESWKSSDEEEYMWDDLNSKLSDKRTVDISQSHGWTPDDSNRSGFENGLRRPEGMHQLGSRIDRETSTDALSTERKDRAPFGNRSSPSWRDDQHLLGETYSGPGRGRLVNSEGSPNPLNGGSLPTDSLRRTPSPSQLRPSQIGVSNSGFPQYPELDRGVSVGQKRSLSEYLGEEDYLPSHPPRHQEITKSQFSGISTMRSQISYDPLPSHSHTPPADSLRYPPQNLQALSLTMHSLPPRHQVPLADRPSEYHQSLLPQKEEASKYHLSTSKLSTSLSSRNGLPDSLNKSDILAKKPGTSTLSSSSVPNRPLPRGAPPKTKASDPRRTAKSVLPSQGKSSASTVLPQIKAEQPPLPPGPSLPSQSSSSASDPVASLLSTLMAKGLITASKNKSPTHSMDHISAELPKSNPSTTDTNSVPIPSIPISVNKEVVSNTNEHPKSAPEVLSDTNEHSKSAVKCSVEDIKPLIGLEFKADVIRQSHPSVISELLDHLPHQCDMCGLRLKLPEQFERHLEWHALRKPDLSCSESSSRRWYANSDNWMAGKVGTASEDETTVELEEPEAMVRADESQCVCVLCGEIFEDFYCHKTDEWMFKGAVYLSMPLGDSNAGTSSGSASQGPIVHANCISENSLEDLGIASCVK